MTRSSSPGSATLLPDDLVGRVMACFRKFALLKQQEVATALGVTQGRVAHIESGRNPPTSVHLLRFEKLLLEDEDDPIVGRAGFVLEVAWAVAESLKEQGVVLAEPPRKDSEGKPLNLEIENLYPRKRLDRVVTRQVDQWLESHGV